MLTTKSFRLIFLATIIIFSNAILTAQIKIKERVEISPGKISKPQIQFDLESVNARLPMLDPNDFALNGGGGFIAYYDDIYNDMIFIPRVGGTIGIAYDSKYLGHVVPLAGDNKLCVYGSDGNINTEFLFNEWFDENGEWNKYAFSQEKYLSDRRNDSLWQINNPNFFPDSLDWGYYPATRMFLHVKAWEPLRFRYFFQSSSDPDSGTYTLPINNPNYNLYTDYPDPFGFAGGSMVLSSIFDNVGEVFPMYWVSRDSGAIGPLPIIYLEPQPEFYLPDSGKYRVIIGNVLPNVNGTLSVIDTMSHVLLTDVRSHQGDTVLIGPYAQGTVLKFDLNGMAQCGRQGDYASGGIGFESWIDYDFLDAAIWVEYAAGRTDHLELWSTSETIYYGDTLDVDIVPCDKDSLFSPFGDDYKYEFSVELTGETSKYVELIYNDQGSNLVEHIPSYNRRGTGVRLAADKIEPDSVVELTFRLRAHYLGPIGPASSVATVPNSQSQIKVLARKSSINQGKQIVSYKDGKITLSFGKQKKEINRFGTKKLQAISAAKQPKMKKIGHILIANKNNGNPYLRQNVASASLSKKTILASTMDGEKPSPYETEWVMGINPPQEILLGETIYFQAVEDPIQSPEHKNKLLIIQFKKINEKHTPLLTGVKFSLSRIKGDKLGVYYDEKIDSNGFDLEPGIIRLVGRYWIPGDENKYIVILNAQTSDRNGHMMIEVKKPIILGDPNLTDETRKTKVKDVLGNDLWLDEWIIKYAGEYGIFPQIIKAQIQCESNFKPAYRWEPFENADEQKKGNFNNSRYKITLNPRNEGDPPIPWEDHINAKPIYPHSEYMTIWDRLYNNSRWLNTSALSSTYDGTRANGDYIWPIENVTGWEDAFLEAISDIKNSVDDARTAANKWLHDKYSMIDEPAQTRIAASYGFLQMLYTTAVYRGYDKDIEGGVCDKHLPEYLNETENDFHYAVPYLAKKLSNVITDLSDKDGNWPLGYEATIKIALNSYNGRIFNNSYGKNVINVRNIYYPNLNITK